MFTLSAFSFIKFNKISEQSKHFKEILLMLELSVLRGSRERNHISNVGHTRNKKY